MCLYMYTYMMCIHLPNFKRTSSRVPSLHNFSALVFLGVGNSCARRHCANGPPCSLPLSRLFPSPKYGFIKAFSTSLAIRLLPQQIRHKNHDDTSDHVSCLLHRLDVFWRGPAWPSAEDSQVRNSQAASIFPSVPAEWEKIKDLGHIE